MPREDHGSQAAPDALPEARSEEGVPLSGASSSMMPGPLVFPAGASLSKAFAAYVGHRMVFERAANPGVDGRDLIAKVRRSWKSSAERSQFVAGLAGVQL